MVDVLASAEVGAGVLVEDVSEEFSVDDLQLPSRGALDGECRDPVDVAEAALSGLHHLFPAIA